jgi:hypothetical protein
MYELIFDERFQHAVYLFFDEESISWNDLLDMFPSYSEDEILQAYSYIINPNNL